MVFVIFSDIGVGIGNCVQIAYFKSDAQGFLVPRQGVLIQSQILVYQSDVIHHFTNTWVVVDRLANAECCLVVAERLNAVAETPVDNGNIVMNFTDPQAVLQFVKKQFGLVEVGQRFLVISQIQVEKSQRINYFSCSEAVVLILERFGIVVQ